MSIELVLLGLDLFPDYSTFAAAGVPVIGMLPILPSDYTADALFLMGDNATVGAAMVAVAKDHFRAATVGIVNSDDPGVGGGADRFARSRRDRTHDGEGGDNETDAGYQG